MSQLTATRTPPARTSVLVIGGGPAGSYAATVLAREGMNVVLIEAAKFPRYHIGEGMLPSMRHYLRYIDCLEKFENHGFMRKPGSCFKLLRDFRETYTDFKAIGPDFETWNCIRSEMDQLLLDHSRTQGVNVFEATRVESLDFAKKADILNARPVAATWTNQSGEKGKILFDWLIDASGRNGLMSTKYLKNRQFREQLRNVAVWGYWRDVQIYSEGTPKANAPWFEAMIDGKGWAWLIPLHDGTTSIGVVMHQDISNEKKKNHPTGSPSLQEHYMEQLLLLPGVQSFIGSNGYFVEGSIHGSSDYSYAADRYAGNNYRIIGDAANFVDPFFASGVHIAMAGAMAAAITIRASINGDITEKLAQEWHTARVGMSHTRFLFIVSGAYSQMKQQQRPLVKDVKEEDFDRAFATFRPVIAGLSDVSEEFTNNTIQKVLEFCAHFFEPGLDLKDVIAVKKNYDHKFSDLSGPVLSVQEIEQVTNGDRQAKKVMVKMNAVKVLREEVDYVEIEDEGLMGYTAVTQRGALGLKRRQKRMEQFEKDHRKKPSYLLMNCASPLLMTVVTSIIILIYAHFKH